MNAKSQGSFQRMDCYWPETRTSAPIQIKRDKLTLESTSHRGFYPCGEGAGHAGGITSAAIDGINVADQMITKYF